MSWLKTLGVLAPLGILAVALAGLAGLGTGLSSPPASVGATATGVTAAVVVVVLGVLCIAGARWGGWLSTPYW